MQQTRFEDNQVHSTYSDGNQSLKKIFEYNNLHDKLDLVITDHVNFQETDWFPRYVQEIQTLREYYPDFKTRIGCEVKVLDEEGTLNASDEIIKAAEVVLGSVHHFPNIKTMRPEELSAREFALAKGITKNKRVTILAHPFGMGKAFHDLDPSPDMIADLYHCCVNNGIQFEYNYKYATPNITAFVKTEIAKGNINHFSFGSDVHDVSSLGEAAFAMLESTTILVTSVGGGVGQSIIKALSLSKMPTRIITVDNNAQAAGLYRGDVAYLVPLAKEKGYEERLIEICNKEQVHVIVPGSDAELPILARRKEAIESATNAKILISDERTIAIADDKWETALFLQKNNFPYAQSYLPHDIEVCLATLSFPLIVKPRRGARSIGLKRVSNKKELQEALTITDEPIIQEYLVEEDEEYTCGLFFYEGKNYGAISIKRWLRNGDTYKAIAIHNPELERFVISVGECLALYGPCNMQLRKTKKGYVIFEINARFSGTTGMQSYLGFNIINTFLQKERFGRPLKPLHFRESYVFRYWNEVFVSPDDVTYLTTHQILPHPKSQTNDSF